MSWKRTLFATASLALFFLGVELLLLLSGVAPLLAEHDPFAGFSGRMRVYELDPSGESYRTVPRAVIHSFHPQQFAALKPRNGFRIFTLGDSSAFGFPWGAEIAFPRPLGAALQAAVPERTIESINAAAMSYGSHRLRILITELLDYEPDVVVIYVGHNEFIERRFYRDLLGRRPELDVPRTLLHRWRLYSQLARWYGRSRLVNGEEPARGGRSTGELLGFDVVRENSQDVGPGEIEQVRSDLRENLEAIAAAARRLGVPVVLCTVPSNLRDWEPNQAHFDRTVPAEGRRRVGDLLEESARALARGDAGAALAPLENALGIAPAYAETLFRLGRAYEALGRWAEADRAYRDARDADAQPARAPEALNATIRSMAGEPGVLVVDVERAFVEAAEHGLLGFNLFEDYVHPKPVGHRLIARELWRAILEHGLLGGGREAIDSDFEHALSGPDFALVADGDDGPAAARGEATVRQLFNLAIVLENQGLEEQAMEKYRAVLERRPVHHAARSNLARLLLRKGRLADAEREYRVALETARGEPLHATILLGLGDAVRGLGRVEQAVSIYRESTEIDPLYGPAWGRLGGALAAAGRHREAEEAFVRAIELDARDVEALAGSGLALLLQGRIGEALARFRRSLELRPDHLGARNGLAAALTESGELNEAERIFREVLRDAPGDAMAEGGLVVIARRRAAL